MWLFNPRNRGHVVAALRDETPYYGALPQGQPQNMGVQPDSPQIIFRVQSFFLSHNVIAMQPLLETRIFALCFRQRCARCDTVPKMVYVVIGACAILAVAECNPGQAFCDRKDLDRLFFFGPSRISIIGV